MFAKAPDALTNVEEMMKILKEKLTPIERMRLFLLMDEDPPAGPLWEACAEDARSNYPEEFVVDEEKDPICVKCNKKKLSVEEWAALEWHHEADRQFDAGEWSDAAHDKTRETYCQCQEPCEHGAPPDVMCMECLALKPDDAPADIELNMETDPSCPRCGERNCERMTYVNAYAVTRHYGGPEEGGWWFNAGMPLASVPCAGDTAKVELQLHELLDHIAEGDIYSVLGGTAVETRVECKFAEPWPKVRPHYE